MKTEEIVLYSINTAEQFCKYAENAKKGYKDTIVRDIIKCYVDISIYVDWYSKHSERKDYAEKISQAYSSLIYYLRMAVDLKIISIGQISELSKKNIKLKEDIQKYFEQN